MSVLSSIADRLLRLAGPIERRLNPILVKELRQALRGRYFSVVFWIMVTLATFIGCVILTLQGSNPQDDAGVVFFVAMYACLSVSVHLFVPFAAFLSVGSEWEENTFDLLVLSDLKPRQIILGKLLSACLQILLFYCAFVPFMVFAFLLRGLDIVGAGWLLGLTLASSTALCSLALCLSSLVRQRFGRVFLMAMLSVVLVWASIGGIAFAVTLFEERFIHTPEFRQAAAVFLTCLAVMSTFSVVVAATRFAHQEENRSTGLRVLTTLTALAGCGWAYYLSVSLRQPEVAIVLGTVTMLGVFVTSISFCTEEEELGRRVRQQLPRRSLTALLATPFLPGGARGVLLFWLNAALVCTAVYLTVQATGPLSSMTQDVPYAFVGVLVYAALYLHLVSGPLARRRSPVSWRVMARVAIPLTVVLGVVLPMVAGLLLRSHDVQVGRHVGNPIWVISEAVEESNRGPLMLAVIGVGAAVLLNLPRVLRALREGIVGARARAASLSASTAVPIATSVAGANADAEPES